MTVRGSDRGGRIPAISATLLIALTVLPPLQAGAFHDLASPGSSADWPHLLPASSGKDSLRLRFNGWDFDPMAGTPASPGGLVGTHGSPLLLVQFAGPILPSWTKALRDAGAEPVWYLPDFAFVVRASPGTADDLRSLPGVRWVGPYHAGYKISEQLGAPIGRPPELGGSATPVPVTVLALDPPVSHGAAEAIRAAGGKVRSDGGASAEGWVAVEGLSTLARDPDVLWIAPAPVRIGQNLDSSRLLDIRQESDGPFTDPGDALWSWDTLNATPAGTNGTGVVIAIADTGVYGAHQMFPAWKKRAFFAYGAAGGPWSDCQSHGTKVGGSAAGWNASNAGMAPGAQIIGQIVYFCGAGATMATHHRDAVANGAHLSANPWEDGGNDGDYNANSAAADSHTRDADTTTPGDQPLLILFPAGNSGPGAGTVAPPGTAKNVIMVAASTADGAGLAAFSGRGPTDDGRRKPDLAVPGLSLTTSTNTGPSDYFTGSGTSLATGVATGAAAMVFAARIDQTGTTPSPALVKALLVNGATPIPGQAYPGDAQGWGLVNVARSVLETPTRKIWVSDQNASLRLDTAEKAVWTVTMGAASEFRVTLVWTDVAGAGSNPIPALVNDLDLTLTDPAGTVYRGNVFSGGTSTTGGASDALNNVEGTRFMSPMAGDWRIEVTGRNVPLGPQDFALVLSGDLQGFVERDVAVTGIGFSDATPFAGDTIMINGTIVNQAPSSVTGVAWELRRDFPGGSTTVITSGAVATLAPGGSAAVSFLWTTQGRGNQTITLVADPANALSELDESDNEANASLFVRVVDFTLVRSGANVQSIPPNGTAVYPYRLTNTGNVPWTFEVTTLGTPAGWSANAAPASLPLGEAANGTFELSVHAAADAMAGDAAVVEVSVLATGRPGEKRDSTATTVIQVFGAALAADRATATIRPGGPAGFVLTVTNTGNGPDRIAVDSGLLPTGWSSDLDVAAFDLGRGGSAEAHLEVTAPATALAGDQANLTITATAGGSPPGQSATLPLTVTVVRIRGINMTVVPVTAVTGPGGAFLVDVQLENRGNSPEIAAVGMVAFPGWPNPTAEPPVVVLEAGGSATVALRLAVPSGAPAGDVPATVRAAIEGPPEILTLEEETTLRVAHVPGLLLGGNLNATLRANQTAGSWLNLTNTGNAPDAFRLVVRQSTPDLRVDLPERTPIIPARATLSLQVNISNDGAAPGSHRIVVRAVSVADPSVTAELEGRLTVLPPAPGPGPGPVPPPPVDRPQVTLAGLWWVGVVVAAAAVALLLVLLRRRQPPGAPATSPSAGQSEPAAPGWPPGPGPGMAPDPVDPWAPPHPDGGPPRL